MKSSRLLSVIGLSTVIVLSNGIVQAGPHRHGGRHGDIQRAWVEYVKPIYETHRVKVIEREHCGRGHDKRIHRSHDAVAETLVGGAIGGLLGNRLANDGHRAPATVAGSLVGAVVGHEVAKGRPPMPHRHDRPERCRDVARYHDEERLVGYRVKYRYHGKSYWTRTKNHPGKYIDVHVDVRPAEF